jgi:cytosine/adenosine deaminase-related metal-dependent hydrolase
MTLTLTNARILTMDAGLTEYRNGWIRIEGNRIAALGEGAAPSHAGEMIDMGGDVVMPGMVNPHCHMTMTLFRGLGEDVDDRLFRYVLPLERECVTPRTVAIGSRLAALEMIRAGVTTVADMYYFETEVGRVIDESGMRGIVGQTLADFAAPDHKSFDEGFVLTEELVETFAGHNRVTASIAPHAPYSTDVPVMARVAEWSNARPGIPVQLHMAEMVSENEWAAKTHGLRPVEVVDKAGLLKPGLIAAHCLFVTDEDMDRMAESDVRVAHNARSNAKAGRGIAPIEAMRGRGIPVGIATDGPMSGNTLDLFSQFGPVSMFQKLLGNSRKPMPATDIIRMATLEGAKVLGMDRDIGSLEPGKQADLIRISLADPRVQPVYDIYATLVFSAMPCDVRDVMVAGKWLMRERAVHTLEEQKVIADALQVAAEFNARIERIDRRKT